MTLSKREELVRYYDNERFLAWHIRYFKVKDIPGDGGPRPAWGCGEPYEYYGEWPMSLFTFEIATLV